MGKQCLGQLQSQSKRRVSTPGSSILLLLLVYVPNPLFLTECLVVTVSWPNTGPDSCGSANERMRALVSPKKTAERSHSLSFSFSLSLSSIISVSLSLSHALSRRHSNNLFSLCWSVTCYSGTTFSAFRYFQGVAGPGLPSIEIAESEQQINLYWAEVAAALSFFLTNSRDFFGHSFFVIKPRLKLLKKWWRVFGDVVRSMKRVSTSFWEYQRMATLPFDRLIR